MTLPRLAFALALLSPSLAFASPQATTCYTKSTVVSGVRERFLARPYQKPRYSFRSYQVWGGGRNFLTIVDTDGDFETGNWWSESDVEARFVEVLNQYYQTQPDTAEFIVVFSAFQVPFPGAFYLPLANDIRGIGYKHDMWQGRETFDTTDGSPLDGILLMNDYTIWGGLDGLSVVFNQEIGHRWGAFMYYMEEGALAPSDLLLGRDLSHWSFFFNSGASPMEGNLWMANEDGTFTSRTEQANHAYHPLDLYAMGLIPAEEVGEFWFIDNPDTTGLSRRGIDRETGPAYFRSYTLPGTKKTLGIEDIIRSEGERFPPFPNTPRNFKIGFILVVKRGQQTDTALLNDFADTLDGVVAGWQAATGNRATLEVVSSGPPPPPQKNLGDPCTGIFECNAQQATACIAAKRNTAAGKFCARRCSSTDPCPSDFCCAAADLLGEPRYCFPTSAEVCPPPPPPPDAGTVADGGTQRTPSGGCAAAGPAAGGSALVLLALLLVAVGWRRREGR